MTPLFDDDSRPSPSRSKKAPSCCAASSRRKRRRSRRHRRASPRPRRSGIWSHPAGYTMSVAMTNCGRVGWVSDRRATATIPSIPTPARPGPRCPPLPRPRRPRRRRGRVRRLRSRRLPDQPLRRPAPNSACIRTETRRTWAPIVSVSLGLPAVFLWGGKHRAEPVRRLRLESGDVAVWGGPARFVYHGVAPAQSRASTR